MWVIYLIQNSETKEKYCGVTSNLRERLNTHNKKGKKFTTRNLGEWVLIYAESYRDKEDALMREKKLKQHGSAKHELFKRLQKSLIV